MSPQPDADRTPLLVCLVEYNPLAASHLRQTLDADPTLRLLLANQVFNTTKKTPVSIFVLDRGTLPAPLSKFLRFVHFRFPDAKAIVLDEPCAHEELVRLLFLGIQGFLTYRDVDAHLGEAIHSVADGNLWFAPAVLEQHASYLSHLSRLRAVPDETFTRREKRIVELVQRRLSNKEIASILGVTESTVKFHLSKIFIKLGVQDRHSMIEVISARRSTDVLPYKPK